MSFAMYGLEELLNFQPSEFLHKIALIHELSWDYFGLSGIIYIDRACICEIVSRCHTLSN